jgi:translation initiation factor 1A
MPNNIGGKNYKKRKQGSTDTNSDAYYIERQAGQFPARVVRNLGNRNMLCFCNDNKLRICHVRGTMKGRIWIEIGDVVLISLRELTNEEKNKGKTDRGDILAKYAPEHHSKLRKEAGVNERIFLKLETMEGIRLEEVGIDKTDTAFLEKDDIGIEFDNDAPMEEEKEIDINDI